MFTSHRERFKLYPIRTHVHEVYKFFPLHLVRSLFVLPSSIASSHSHVLRVRFPLLLQTFFPIHCSTTRFYDLQACAWKFRVLNFFWTSLCHDHQLLKLTGPWKNSSWARASIEYPVLSFLHLQFNSCFFDFRLVGICKSLPVEFVSYFVR